MTEDNTYITSPGYPAPAPAGMCMVSINKCDANICQFRSVPHEKEYEQEQEQGQEIEKKKEKDHKQKKSHTTTLRPKSILSLRRSKHGTGLEVGRSVIEAHSDLLVHLLWS